MKESKPGFLVYQSVTEGEIHLSEESREVGRVDGTINRPPNAVRGVG